MQHLFFALALAFVAASASATTYQLRIASPGIRGATATGAIGTLTGDTNFGEVIEGDSVSRTFTFTNRGDAVASGVFAWLSDYPELTVLSNNCGMSGAVTTIGFTAGANSCEVSLLFAPVTGASSLTGAQLGVEGNFTGAPKELSLIGYSAPLQVTLAAATLPVGLKGTSYNGGEGFDLKNLLSSNSQATDKGQATWSVTDGALPPGLSLSSQGVIAGSPESKTIGAEFSITASYKSKQSAQTYTIVVNGVSLEVAKVSMSLMHGCALLVSGKIKCWGYSNSDGAMGSGDTTSSLTPRDVVGISNATDVAAGASNTCAIDSGAVKCWGKGISGNLGNGENLNSYVPVAVSGLGAGVKAITVGSNHACAITASGAAKCWGHNSSGKLGDGTFTARNVPVQVTGLTSGVTDISAGDGMHHTCAIQNGAAKCWGSNSYGELGNGTQTDSRTPVQVSGLGTGVTSISAGGTHSCAIRNSNAYCWGENTNGQIGDGTQSNLRLSPVLVVGPSGATLVDAGRTHTCALTSTQGVTCWGDNASGKLGDGTTITRTSPVGVVGLGSDVSEISAGQFSTCARIGTSAKCWGSSVTTGGGGTSSVPIDLE